MFENLGKDNSVAEFTVDETDEILAFVELAFSHIEWENSQLIKDFIDALKNVETIKLGTYAD